MPRDITFRRIEYELRKIDPDLNKQELERRAQFLVDNSRFLIRLWLERHDSSHRIGASTEFSDETGKPP